MNTYSLDQNPIPQTPMTVEEHHRFINLSIILAAVALIIGILYWWTTGGNNGVITQDTTPSADLRSQVAAILRTAPVQASQQDIDRVASQLSSAKSGSAASQTQSRQAMASLLSK